jgi:cytochrome b involved in lipid metabolism
MNEEINEVSVVEETPNKKNLLISVIGVILVFSILYIVYRSKQPQNLKQTADIQAEKIISLSEILLHNSKESCWTTINGEVFDVTKFTDMHKGGDRILNACGIDATDLFTGKSPMGRVHSQLAVKLLSGMKIGTLQQ